MKKQILPNLIYCIALLFFCGTVLSSCEKIPGHTIVPSGSGKSTSSGGSSSGSGTGSGTGSGSGSGSGSGTGSGTGSGSGSGSGSGITVNPAAGTPNANGVGPVAVGATNTIIYQVNGGTPVTVSNGGSNQLAFTAVDFGGGIGQTGITGVGSSGTFSFIAGYFALTPGIYSTPGSFTISTGTYNLSDNLGTEKINVTTESITPTTLATITTQATGTIKGTFDGTMVDSNSGLTLRVSGSFNLQQ